MDKYTLFREARKNILNESQGKKIPAYQELEMDPPPTGGQSLLHKDGMPLVSKKQQLKPVQKNIYDEESIKVLPRNNMLQKPNGQQNLQRNINPRTPLNHAVPPPQQQLINSGMNEDQMWMSDSVAVPVYNEEPDVDISHLQGYNSFENNDEAFSLDPALDPALDPTLDSSQDQSRLVSTDENSLKSNSFGLEPGEFGVFVYGNLEKHSFDPSVIRGFIEHLIFKTDVDTSQISVIKSINFDFGVILSDG